MAESEPKSPEMSESSGDKLNGEHIYRMKQIEIEMENSKGKDSIEFSKWDQQIDPTLQQCFKMVSNCPVTPENRERYYCCLLYTSPSPRD